MEEFSGLNFWGKVLIKIEEYLPLSPLCQYEVKQGGLVV